MPYLKSKNYLEFFHFLSTVHSEFFRVGSGNQTFLVIPNLKPKVFSEFFSLLTTLDWNFRAGVQANFFWSCQISGQIFFQNFFISKTLDSKFFRGGVWAPYFLGNAKFEVKISFRIFIYQALWTLNFLEGGLDANFFWSRQIRNQKFFRNFFCLLKTLAWISQRECLGQLFCLCQILGQ